jgi:hypothetical protein
MGSLCSIYWEIRAAHGILVGKPEGIRPFRNLGVYGMIILKLILRKSGGRLWTGFMLLRIGTGIINGCLGSVKSAEFLDLLDNYELVEKVSAS